MKRNDLRKEELKKNTKSGIRTWQTNKKEAVSASTSGCNADETLFRKERNCFNVYINFRQYMSISSSLNQEAEARWG